MAPPPLCVHGLHWENVSVNPCTSRWRWLSTYFWRPLKSSFTYRTRLRTVMYCSLFIHSCTAAISPWQRAQISPCDSDPLKRDLCRWCALWLRWPCFYSRNSILTQCIILGGFHLRKWVSNSPELLDEIPVGDHKLAFDYMFDEHDTWSDVATGWQCISIYNPLPPSPRRVSTKRTVLFFIALWSAGLFSVKSSCRIFGLEGLIGTTWFPRIFRITGRFTTRV